MFAFATLISGSRLLGPGRLHALVLSFAALVLGGCAPKPSSVPLGLGPLALTERSNSPATVVASVAEPVAPAPAQAVIEVEPDEPESSSEPSDEASSAETADGDKAPKSAPDTPPNFPGLYAGSDVASFGVPGLPDQLDDKAKLRIEKASGENIRIVIINTTDGSDMCTLLARVEGNAALIEKPQPCFGSEGEGGVQADLSSGRVVLDGDSLTMDAKGTVTVDLGEQELEGEFSYSFQGQRQ